MAICSILVSFLTLLYFAFTNTAHRFLGALTNSGRTSANFTGFYKSLQSAGAAFIWHLDSSGTPYMTEFIVTWSILAGALVCAAPVIFYVIKDTNSTSSYPDTTGSEADREGWAIIELPETPPKDSSRNHTSEASTTAGNSDLQPSAIGAFQRRMQPRNEHHWSSLSRESDESLDQSGMSFAQALQDTEEEASRHEGYAQAARTRNPL